MSDPAANRGDAPPAMIDVDQIVEDIRDRADARRLRGRSALKSFGRDRVELQPGRVVLRPEVAVSHRRGVGTALSAAKRLQLRLVWPLLMDLVVQINAALDVQRLMTSAEGRRRLQLEQRVAQLEDRIRALEGTGPTAGTVDHQPVSS